MREPVVDIKSVEPVYPAWEFLLLVFIACLSLGISAASFAFALRLMI